MTILHLRSAEFYGSPERLILGQCRHIEGIDFRVASYVRGGSENRFLVECHAQEVPAFEIDESFAGDLRVVRRLKRLIEEQGVDLLVTHDYKSNFYGHMARKRFKIPQVGYFHGVTSENLKVKLYNLIDRFVLPKLDKVVAVSSMTAQFLKSRGLRAEKIEVVANAVDPDTLKPERNDKRDPRRPCQILAIGRFSYEKGFDILMEAVAAVVREAPPFEILLYGMGPEEDNLRTQVKQLELDQTVKFCGFVDNILPILDESDFMVMSSRSEGMPVVLLEAWSQRVGVLATTVGGIPEMIESGSNGLLVEPENVPQLSEKLRWAVENRDKMDLYGQAGFDVLRKRYTFQVQAEALERIYLGLLGNKDGR